MNCCSGVLENQNASFKIAALVSGLAALAALIGGVALVCIFTLPVALCTAALVVCVGSFIAASLLAAIATALFCKARSVPEEPIEQAPPDEKKIMEHLQASLAHYHNQFNSLVMARGDRVQQDSITSIIQSNAKHPAKVHFAKTVEYQFVIQGMTVTIDYDPLAKKFSVTINPFSNEYKDLIANKLRELVPECTVE